MPNTDQTAADLETFDLDGFIAGIVHPSRVVAVTQDRDLGQRIEEARQAVEALEEIEDDSKTSGKGSRRRAAATATPELEEARAHLKDLEEEAGDTLWFVKVSGGLTRAIKRQAQADSRGDEDRYGMSILAHCARLHRTDPRVNPDDKGHVMTLDQWEEFTEVIGIIPEQAINNAMIEVSSAGVSPDFSQPASPSPDGDTSSKS